MDQELVQRSQAGELLAFEMLYGRYADRLLRLLGKKCFPPVSVDDIAQDAWTMAFTNIHSFQGDRFFSWLSRIAINLAIDASRRLKKMHLDNDMLNLLPQESQREESDLLSHLRDCVNKVGRNWVVITRCLMEGLSPPEIADKLGLDIVAVYRKSNNARAKIRECLQRKGLL